MQELSPQKPAGFWLTSKPKGCEVAGNAWPLAVPVRENGALPLCAERVFLLIRPLRGTFPKREGKAPQTKSAVVVSASS